MLIFSLIVIVIWLAFVFVQEINRKSHWSKLNFGLLLLLNFAIGVVTLLALFYLNQKITLLVLGGILIISGLKNLAILKRDLFSFLEKKVKPKHKWLVKQIPLLICWATFLGESNTDFSKTVLFLLLFVLILAGFLQLLLTTAKSAKPVQWQKELIITLNGLFLVINGLIVMSGDVQFFLNILSKFYTII